MKKVFALMLAALMLVLAGCGGTTSSSPETTIPQQSLEADVQGAAGRYTFPTLPMPEEVIITEPDEDEVPPVELEQLGEISRDSKLEHEDLEYVMIYNPYVYDENRLFNDTLSTGDMKNQIVVDMNRADGLTEDPEYIPMGQDALNPLELTGVMEGDRAGTMGREFQKGDKEKFYVFEDSGDLSYPRKQKEFTCAYAGQYCNIWVYNKSISNADAQACAEEFDNNIYEQTVEKFGEPRFESRVNLLYYPMPDGLLGCFCNIDLLTASEAIYYGVSDSGCNTDVNLLHMNARYDATSANIISTMAHEFQHLICFTDAFGTVDLRSCNTWFNEAMSGYVEEMIYPGVQLKAGRMDSYMNSNRIRYGQSLYNFDTTTTALDWDIGVYGSVYLYSMYADRVAGEDVFTDFHQYWRTSYSDTLDVAEALASSVPNNVFRDVDESVTYPEELLENGFTSEKAVWLSKLTLQFYLDILDVDDSDPADFRNVDPEKLLYDQVDAAQIEGGGRVLIKLKDNSYKIPTKAGEGLIYIGLDEDFNVVCVSYN